MWESRRMSAYWSSLRGASPRDALTALGRFAAGRDCALAARGTALHGKGSDVPLIDRSGSIVPAVRVLPDKGLDALGVELVSVGPSGLASAIGHADRFARLVDTGALVCRAGLMMRCLVQAYAHLEGRESAGQPTLQLPLVKATFTECASLADRIRREAAKHLEDGLGLDLAAEHVAVSTATARAAKLMGGHGYLADQTNAIETFSLLLAASFAPQSRQRSAA
jgi:hypothetical protein